MEITTITSTPVIQYNIQDEPLVFSKFVCDVFLTSEFPGDSMALYWFYYYTAKWQGTSRPKATTQYTAQGLNWSVEKVRRIKEELRILDLIKDVIEKNEAQQVIGHYIQLNLVDNTTKNHPREKPDGGSRHSVGNPEGNALNTDNKNALKSYMVITNKKIIKSMFDKFWECYPNKSQKGKALTMWNRICEKPTSERPEWRVIRIALKEQKQSQRWQTPKFIPHASTWLNQSRWLDDASTMISYNTSPIGIGYTDEVNHEYRNDGEL